MKTLRLILGDQLNSNHSWFNTVDSEVIYLMAEMRQETDYVKHHIQKIVGFFNAMRSFCSEQENKGHEFIYLKINDSHNSHKLESLIFSIVKEKGIEKFEYLQPDEFRLDQELKTLCNVLEIPVEYFDTEHFYSSRDELNQFFKGKKQLIMESFYRMMRRKHDIMMVNGQPDGGKWNFDHSNRKKWKGTPNIPSALNFKKDVTIIFNEIEKSGVNFFGNIEVSNFQWPSTKTECKELLAYFCEHLLIHFGDYQDAMHTEQKYLFHSRLSFAMNIKMISPKEVIEHVLSYYYEHTADINISQVEGFVRQILGWREFMRGIYWKEMPSYKTLNKLENHNPLPDFFWTGKTKMNCLHKSINQSLDDAYAHHIQRLMIIGNYALLTQIHPNEVDYWYLGVYIDAIEWVEITNTRGMSQFADGGIVATKPYVSSANYINKMGDYCKKCHYKHSKKVGEDACPFNALYWNFLDEKKEYFQNNQRMSMMLNLLNKKDKEELVALKQRAREVITNPDNF